MSDKEIAAAKDGATPVERLKKYVPINIPFEQSYTLDGVEITSATMRPPTCGDVINAQTMASSEHHEKALLHANLCGLSEVFVSELGYYDSMLLEAAYSRFLFPLAVFSEMLSHPLANDLEAMIFSD